MVIHSLGHKVVRIGTTFSDSDFTVDEDLLCAGSELFKAFFQPTRKPVEEDCPICFEKLDSTDGKIAFCRGTCGQNLHTKCWDTWAKEQPRAQCPMCRANWENPEDSRTLHKFKVQSDALQTKCGMAVYSQNHPQDPWLSGCGPNQAMQPIHPGADDWGQDIPESYHGTHSVKCRGS